MPNLREQFLIDPDVAYLNHGSFGATPRPVFETYQQWQRRLERQPFQFLLTELPDHFAHARQRLGNYLNASSEALVYIPNATFGVNVVANSLPLGPGDELLTTNHEYGACDNVWNYYKNKRGFNIVRQSIPLPVTSADAIVEQIWQGVTKRTKAIFLSHITSSTALRLPIEAICARARKAGIWTIIDGAHALGQIPLDMAHINADFYTSNAHKWLCAPKGAAFLYTRPELHHLIEPLVVGWGWGEDRTFSYGSDYLDYLQYLGTDDLASYFSVPAAIDFQAEYDWPTVRQQCHQLLLHAMARITELTDLPAVYPNEADYFHQLAIVPMPPISDLQAFQSRLYKQFRVEIPFTEWQDRQFIRISVQGYNTEADIDRLVDALQALLPQTTNTWWES